MSGYRMRIRYRMTGLGPALLALAVAVLAVRGEGEGTAVPTRAEGEPAAETAESPSRITERQAERDAMVATIRRYGFEDEAVLAALARVPRHAFVPQEVQRRAYDDTPLPIGHGQTISQPYIVAVMTQMLELGEAMRVLEIGTGSGYQAAVLKEFTPQVYSIEIIEPLAERAAQDLTRAGYDGVEVKAGDGYFGWPEKAPFDAIIVTCAAGQIPPPLIRQLARGGRMVIPIGPAGAMQTLYLLEKDEEDRIRSRSLMSVRFVPLTRHGPLR